MTENTPTTADDDGYFGLCPHCHKTDGYLNAGPNHYFLCKEHKVCWYIGINLFSNWRDETAEEQQAAWEAAGLNDFEAIEPFRPSAPAQEPKKPHLRLVPPVDDLDAELPL